MFACVPAFSADAILSMVNNLAANMLGANTEEEITEGKGSRFLFLFYRNLSVKGIVQSIIYRAYHHWAIGSRT